MLIDGHRPRIRGPRRVHCDLCIQIVSNPPQIWSWHEGVPQWYWSSIKIGIQMDLTNQRGGIMGYSIQMN